MTNVYIVDAKPDERSALSVMLSDLNFKKWLAKEMIGQPRKSMLQ